MLWHLTNQIPKYPQASLQSKHFQWELSCSSSWFWCFMSSFTSVIFCTTSFQQSVLWSKTLGHAVKRFRVGISMPRRRNVNSLSMGDAKEIWIDLSLLKRAWKPVSQQVHKGYKFKKLYWYWPIPIQLLSLLVCEPLLSSQPQYDPQMCWLFFAYFAGASDSMQRKLAGG